MLTKQKELYLMKCDQTPDADLQGTKATVSAFFLFVISSTP